MFLVAHGSESRNRNAYAKLGGVPLIHSISMFYLFYCSSVPGLKLQFAHGLRAFGGEEISDAGEEISEKGEESSGLGEEFSQPFTGVSGGGIQPLFGAVDRYGEEFSPDLSLEKGS